MVAKKGWHFFCLIEQLFPVGTAENIIQFLLPGIWDFSKLDLGPSEVDWTKTHLSALFTKLAWLNEWAINRADEFVVVHGGWLDERGPVEPVASGGGPIYCIDGTESPNLLQSPPKVGETDQQPAAVDAAPLPHGRAQKRTMPTDKVCAAFDGLVWDRLGWKSLFDRGRRPEWLRDCQHGDGVKGMGGRQAQWHPVLIAVALVKGKSKKKRIKLTEMNSAFNMRQELRPWRDGWVAAKSELSSILED